MVLYVGLECGPDWTWSSSYVQVWTWLVSIVSTFFKCIIFFSFFHFIFTFELNPFIHHSFIRSFIQRIVQEPHVASYTFKSSPPIFLKNV